MFEIYTPKAWLSVFGGSESLRIDDNGYIYTFKEATRIFGGAPCGKVEWDYGKIYGKDFADISRAPIGFMKTDSDGVIEIYNDVPGFFQEPVLYIKANSDNVGEIYTPENFLGLMRGNPSGYIKPMPVVGKSSTPPSPPPSDPPEVKGSIANLIPAGVWVVIGIALFLLFGEELGEKLSNPWFWIAWLGSFALIVFFKKRREKKKKQQQNGNTAKTQRTVAPVTKTSKEAPVQPTSYTHYCTKCGKAYTSKAKNPRIPLCDACKKAPMESPEPPKPTPEPVTVPSGKFTHYCTKCGKPYGSTEKNPAETLCDTCKKQAVPKPTPATKPQTTADGAAVFVSVSGEKTVLACPFCQTKLAIPNGKGNVVIKCASCGKKLSAKS